ncbi:tRNA (adenosine(37)-N6)-dimethylallyltransferase MiaA [Roseovarius sp. PS-C2]|uniref:tRNA (adenosine(37)-N6)-dimethylallyltransferase MiaA n=1 Tax=Roseovarius sp. PS-C2 TaxID=2820814 RepID=UPI001C0C068E|nr:tRNA (adenosine(37)-N6)-dimethylallyltransferase MiaA [Roseovarius sp. PS-C2]MBU3259654.1 tRNA (adenosine(37)-N6)-dimethylallyltransferase MiaA [Roseovarius sp. PS-C2]
MTTLPDIPPDRPVLIAGPTASGKSALALRIAAQSGGVIVNGDAIQVFDNWRILTARPSPEDEAQAAHALYGHVAGDAEYSVGHWLRDVAPLLQGGARPIIVGGTGLYFSALTEGLADIPATPETVRADANERMAQEGIEALLAEIDAATRARIDTRNPMRVQRAWEVLQTTGRGLADWQDHTPPPLLPLSECTALVVEADKDWLNARIARRFDRMLDQGALEEARANLPGWTPSLLSAKAIGAPELIAHLRGEMTLDQAREAATIATRQFAKRQRTWFRSRMRTWQAIDAVIL